jgi:hypothetical protein
VGGGGCHAFLLVHVHYPSGRHSGQNRLCTPFSRCTPTFGYTCTQCARRETVGQAAEETFAHHLADVGYTCTQYAGRETVGQTAEETFAHHLADVYNLTLAKSL